MHFFGSDLPFSASFCRRAEREYLSEFGAWDGQRRVGEASVWYLFSETAAAEIKAFNPSARIIVMLREPSEIMYSVFRFFRYDGNEPLATFAEALRAEPERRAGRGLGRQTYFGPGLVYRDVPRFARQVQRYFQAFGRERVKVVLLEDLAANPAAVYQDALKFLEVDDTHRLRAFDRINPAVAVNSRALRAVLNDPITRTTVRTIRRVLPRRLLDAAYRVESFLTRCNSSTQRPPPLEPELKAQLRREFAAEVEQLGELIGRDLSHWSGVGVRAPAGGPSAPGRGPSARLAQSS